MMGLLFLATRELWFASLNHERGANVYPNRCQIVSAGSLGLDSSG